MTKPADKWMQKAREIWQELFSAEGHAEGQAVFIAIARALEATDKAATERAAQIGYATCAATRHVTLGREVEKNILASDLDAAIRKGTDND